MNQRIRELAKQAGIWFEDSKEVRTHSVSTTTLDRFAELVVQDCARYVADSNLVGIPRDNVVNGMLEYYGVDK